MKYLCEDGFANVRISRLLALATIGADCECCLGARIWLALFVGIAIGVIC